MNNFNVNLTNCDREPIHIPGKIQSQGFLIAVDASTFTTTFVSENVIRFLNISATELLNISIAELTSKVEALNGNVHLDQLLRLGLSQNSFEIINPYRLEINNQPFYLIIHESGDQIIMEFETSNDLYDIQREIGRSVSGILQQKTLRALLQSAADEVKKLIDYDRIMVYQFLEDGHGEVISEVANEDLSPFLGLHYPATDIPQQARALYKLNFTRIIADVNTSDSPIATFSTEPLDLSHSVLRAVSPIHIQYLKNMGVESSFSISIISKGELWGLIACHNYSPKFIDYKAREGAKLIGQILSSAIEYREAEEGNDQIEVLQEALYDVNDRLDLDADIMNALTGDDSKLLEITNASGVAVLFEGTIKTVGFTPAHYQLEDLFTWLGSHMQDSIFQTVSLSSVYEPAKAYSNVASGILACMLSREMNEYIIFFKPEKLSKVNWAGNPDKPVEVQKDGLQLLSPRTSFETWTETVRYTSDKWLKYEISNVIKIRERIIAIVNKKANEIRQLNARLKLAYEELDTFSYTISHDLRTPLTSIKSYTELFLYQNKSIDEKGRHLLNRVVSGADKMSFLINEILKLARVGRTEVDYVTVDMAKLLKETVTDVIASQNAHHVAVVVESSPVLTGDLVLINQVFTNLIGNAVKYAAKSQNPTVTIKGEEVNDEVIYSIKDNGIGIDMSHHNKIFELFKRMENVKEYDGSGVGLAIVKRIVEKHDGRIWLESQLNVGTTFFVAFTK
ncbi:MAG: GAF domain-containing protein [Pedobacter sp.]|nr:MAG: GAF domain-containing protein [Pedobacter sp.]